MTKLRDICRFQSGGTPSRGTPAYFNGNVPWITTVALNGDVIDGNQAIEWITDEAIAKSAAKIVPPHSVMVGTRVGIGKVAINSVPMSTSQDIISLIGIDENKWDKKFICHLITANKEHLTSQARGATIKGIKIEAIADLVLPEISLKEQARISKVIGKVDALMHMHQQMAMNLEQLIKSRFIELFGTIHDNRFGFSVVTLQDVSAPIKDGTHQTPTYTTDVEKGYRFLSSKDVTTGKVDWSHLKYIPEELHRELYARISPRKGDILLAKNGTTGIAAIVDRDEVFDIYVSLALIRPLGVDPTYLWAAINAAETKQQFDASLKGIGVPNLHLGEIKKARIILPPMELQEQFAAFVEQTDKSKLCGKMEVAA